MHIAALLQGQFYIFMTISDVSIYSFIYLNLINSFLNKLMNMPYHPHTLKLEIFLKPQKFGTAIYTSTIKSPSAVQMSISKFNTSFHIDK